MVTSRKILFICGSLNQTTMMHQISKHLMEYEHYFSPYYGDSYIKLMTHSGLLDFSILGGRFKARTEQYLRENHLKVDYRGVHNKYDLVFLCTDIIVPKNIRENKIILVQEGMTDPETLTYKIVKSLKLPRYFASTAMTGLSDAYNIFCVASEGYRNLFIKKGIKPEKLVVTGIPNFDDVEKYRQNDFPYKHYVLVATSDMRETYKYENRKKFIQYALKIAKDRQLIFKLHPNENVERAIREIDQVAPEAIVFPDGNTYHMVANCDVLITRYSSVAHMGVILGKEIHCDIGLSELKGLMPIQNGGNSAYNIAEVARNLINETQVESSAKLNSFSFADLIAGLRLKLTKTNQ